MQIQSLQPPPELAAYVKDIMVIRQDTPRPDFVLPLYANGASTLVFQSVQGRRSGALIGHLSIYGQAIAPSNLQLKDAFVLIAYFLCPYVMQAITGISALELTDTVADMAALKTAREAGLQERLLEAPSLEAQLELINAFLWKRVAADRIDYSRIAFATGALQQDNSAAALSRLRGQLYSTERSMQRLFEEQIGISPRQYKRICQFQAAFNTLNSGRFARLSDIAYEQGFSDQSHFVRVFKEFTGMTPKAYLFLRSGYVSS